MYKYIAAAAANISRFWSKLLTNFIIQSKFGQHLCVYLEKKLYESICLSNCEKTSIWNAHQINRDFDMTIKTPFFSSDIYIINIDFSSRLLLYCVFLNINFPVDSHIIRSFFLFLKNVRIWSVNHLRIWLNQH